MNRRFAWLGGAVGAFAVWKWLKKRPMHMGSHGHGQDSAAGVQDPAAELRAKLEESRAVVEEQASAADEAETTVDAAPDPESRRRSVHEQARARLDGLKGSGPDEG